MRIRINSNMPMGPIGSAWYKPRHSPWCFVIASLSQNPTHYVVTSTSLSKSYHRSRVVLFREINGQRQGHKQRKRIAGFMITYLPQVRSGRHHHSDALLDAVEGLDG